MIPGNKPSEEDLVITRIFDAPRDLVFRVWTDPNHVVHWWGPRGFTTPVCELDVRPGGAIRIDLQGPVGVIYPSKGVFHEVVPPERLVFTTEAFADEAGNPQLEVLNTVTFAEHDGKTKLMLRASIIRSSPAVAAALDGMAEGWNQSLDRLAEHLGKVSGDSIVANDTTNAQQQTSTPNPALKRLDVLVGTWNLSGPTIKGQVSFEWMAGGFFLVQRGEHEQDGRRLTFTEFIGYEQKWGSDEPSKDCVSHVFDSMGHHFEYVWEVDDNTLTIWGGYVGSPAAYKGTFSDDHNTITGAWEWPEGGYEATLTRIK